MISHRTRQPLLIPALPHARRKRLPIHRSSIHPLARRYPSAHKINIFGPVDRDPEPEGVHGELEMSKHMHQRREIRDEFCIAHVDSVDVEA
jgi:hypothetical protein